MFFDQFYWLKVTVLLKKKTDLFPSRLNENVPEGMNNDKILILK
jgi:hypothetical protein